MGETDSNHLKNIQGEQSSDPLTPEDYVSKIFLKAFVFKLYYCGSISCPLLEFGRFELEAKLHEGRSYVPKKVSVSLEFKQQGLSNSTVG